MQGRGPCLGGQDGRTSLCHSSMVSSILSTESVTSQAMVLPCPCTTTAVTPPKNSCCPPQGKIHPLNNIWRCFQSPCPSPALLHPWPALLSTPHTRLGVGDVEDVIIPHQELIVGKTQAVLRVVGRGELHAFVRHILDRHRACVGTRMRHCSSAPLRWGGRETG